MTTFTDGLVLGIVIGAVMGLALGLVIIPWTVDTWSTLVRRSRRSRGG